MLRERFGNVRLDLTRMQRELAEFDFALLPQPLQSVTRTVHDLLAILVRVIDSLP